jgi:hypothetical protein
VGRIFERVVSKGPKVRARKHLSVSAIYWQNQEIIATLRSKSSRRLHREKLKLDDSGNAIFFERSQPQHLATMDFNM